MTDLSQNKVLSPTTVLFWLLSTKYVKPLFFSDVKSLKRFKTANVLSRRKETSASNHLYRGDETEYMHVGHYYNSLIVVVVVLFVNKVIMLVGRQIQIFL